MDALLLWFKQSWIGLAAIIGGITFIWNFFSKTLKEISVRFSAPMKDVTNKLDNINYQLNKTTSALLTMQRNSLLHTCEEFLAKGYATLEQKETVAKQYNSYHELGGDSFITTMVQHVEELPIKLNESLIKEDI